MKNLKLTYSIIALFLIYANGTAQNFQDTKGELSISNSGTANYTIPIATPPSVNGVAPVINLNYSSGARGGIAGQGWNISGISSITRISTRKDIDGFRDGVDFDDNDKLALDGQRLLLKTGIYWADGSTYETEYKSNIKVELKIYTFLVGGVTWSRKRFIVTNPDGSSTWYAATDAGTAITSAQLNATWYIVRHEDVNSNYIIYNYTNYGSPSGGNAQLYIDSIEFAGNVTLSIAPINKIKFNTVVAAREEKDFLGIKQNKSHRILNSIEVFTNTVLFKKYQLSQSTDGEGYQRLSQVQEFNGANEASNPVVFGYEAITSTTPTLSSKSFSGDYGIPQVNLSGDFNGDGQSDFIANNQLYTDLLGGYNGGTPIATPYNWKYAINTLSNNQYNQFQSLLSINEGSNTFEFKTYDLVASQFVNTNSKIINLNRSGTSSCTLYLSGDPSTMPCYNYYLQNCQNLTSFYTQFVKHSVGDFDGDGISEILIEKEGNRNRIVNLPAACNGGIGSDVTNGTASTFYLLDLNPNESTTLGTKGFMTIGGGISVDSIKQVADFNGDGKDDLFCMSGNNYSIFEIKKTETNATTILLGFGTLDVFSNDKPMLFGDYNADGKLDIMIPVANDNYSWAIYYSSQNEDGGSFFTKVIVIMPEKYLPYDSGQTFQDFRSYYGMDLNNDGKTDFVSIKRAHYKVPWTLSNFDTDYSILAHTNVIGTSNSFINTYDSGTITSNSEYMITPFVGSFKLGQKNPQIIMWKHDDAAQAKGYSFLKDFVKENLLKTVSESNGKVIHTIDYATMTNGNTYLSNHVSYYPYVTIRRNLNNYLVSKLSANVNNVLKYQIFKYGGMISNFVYGSIGFKRSARSSWYLTESDTKVWSVDEIDQTLRGAITKTWTTTNASIVLGFTPTIDLLSIKINNFSTYTFPNPSNPSLGSVYNVLLDSQVNMDYLSGVQVIKNYLYDGAINAIGSFGLQTSRITRSYSNNVLQGSTTTTTEYLNNASGSGNSYFIGKPQKVTTSATINNIDGTSDTRTSEEKYTYTGANITKTQKKGHNIDYLVEDMTYDAVGNLLTKTISMPSASPPIASRTITDEYEATKRFVNKKTDHQDFVTLLGYNSLGQVLQSSKYIGAVSATNLFSTNIFTYDNWGKLLTSTTTGVATTALVTTTNYAKLSDGGYTVTATNTQGDQAMSRTQYDVLGRVVKTTTKGFAANTEISKTIEYDALGRKYRESEPYFTTIGKWATTINTYDYLYRPTQMTTSTGRVQTLAYAGLTTTSVDDGKTTKATVNAMGNKVSTTDPGGTITFNYFASGQLKTTNYDGNIITNEIDGWGNKTSTFDPNAGNPAGPNAGNYSYTYDAFGQVKTETTPKGTTSYSYDADGKLTAKSVIGDGADINTVYTYNAFAQLETEVSKTAANVAIDNFGYTYDALHRLTTTLENNANFNHTKTISFDTYGRMNTETNVTTAKGAFANNFASTVVTKYLYNTYNGILYKMTDGSGLSLWELLTANQKMQTLTATLNNGTNAINVINTYDTDFYFTNQQHKKGTTVILNNTYSFNAVKGNLMNRQNTAPGMNFSEAFTYDTLDRLKTWTNPLTGVVDSNNYDDKGRITTNNKLGTVTYNTNAATGIYRKDKIALNTEGLAYYNALAGNQVVSYNMFKSPIQISESGKGKCNFEYNSHQSRSKMLYDNRVIAPITVASQRKIKLYTDDGSTEIVMDLANNTIKIVTFVGGDAYGAVLYNEKTRSATGVIAQADNYLHRDYQGTINAISNSTGFAIEKRAFDAWGNLCKLVNHTNTSLPVINGFVIFDRGYTGHEHLNEVRLIHMNGRLYDPLLRSFLMPDNFVSDPNNTQNYNRYSYVLNNPLRYVDINGEEPISIGIAILIGTAISAWTYTITCLTSGIEFTATGLLESAVIGAASAAVTFGIGSAATNLFANYFSRAAFQAVAHGTFQGTMTAVTGGKFWSGFAAGALSSIAASAWSGGDVSKGQWNGIGGKFADSGAGMIAFGTVAGGAGAALTGGNFWQGAVTGLVVSGLNHAMHQMDSPDDNGYDKNGKKINDNGGDTTDYRYDDNGNIIDSTPVAHSFLEKNFEVMRGYGFSKDFRMATGAITEDNSLFGMYAGGKVIGTGLSYLGEGLNLVKVPVFRAIGQGIRTYAPKLGANRYLRIGTSTSRGNEVFRITWGNNSKHLLDINLGKIPKIK